MRKESKKEITTNLSTMAMYHTGHFNKLTAYNSDRKINLNPDYTVSENNTPSTLKLFKANSRLNLYGIELETFSSAYGNTYGNRTQGTIYANVLDLIFKQSGFDDDFFKTETDCTVSGESVSQTFTKAWMRNNYRSFKAMYDLFGHLGITTDYCKNRSDRLQS